MSWRDCAPGLGGNNMGSIYEKRPGQWFARFKNEHGRWRDRRLDATKKSEAKTALVDLEIETEKKRKNLPQGGKGLDLWTVTKLLEWCLDTYWANTPSADDVRSFLNKHVKESTLGATLMFEVTAANVEKFI